MKVYRSVIALLILAALAIPQAMAVQSAPYTAESTINLQPGDRVTINCPSSLSAGTITRQRASIICRTVANAIATLTATPTRLPGTTTTATSTPTRTPTATGTPPPAGGNSQPYAGAPECPDHNPNAWHALWDPARGCHYDHTHGDDPSLGDGYFGPAGALWGGQTISYPFATSEMENTHKHAGYKWSVKTPTHNPWSPCGVLSHTDNSPGVNHCVVASRVQYHVLSLVDGFSRYHSYYMELYICRHPGYTECGTMKIGGWADYAELRVPHYGSRVTRPGGTIDFGGGYTMDFPADGPDLPARSGEPYVFMRPSTNLEQHRSTSPRLGYTMEQWSMNDLDCEPRPAGDPCHNRYARFLAQVNDSWGLVNVNNPNSPVFICRDGSCAYNGSLTGLEEIAVQVLQSWQSDGGGFVTLNGWTDRWGNPRFDNTCSSVSVDCVPLVLQHVPVGYAASKYSGCLCSHEIEYDISPRGEHWIEFPN